MARHELLEAILQAQFELEYAEPKDLPVCLERLNVLLDQAIAGTHLTRRELLSALRDRYKAYKRAQLTEAALILSSARSEEGPYRVRALRSLAVDLAQPTRSAQGHPQRPGRRGPQEVRD